MVVKQDFANEEDYIKAGGSELLYVQMQQNKQMDQQSKFSNEVYFAPTLFPFSACNLNLFWAYDWLSFIFQFLNLCQWYIIFGAIKYEPYLPYMS